MKKGKTMLALAVFVLLAQAVSIVYAVNDGSYKLTSVNARNLFTNCGGKNCDAKCPCLPEGTQLNIQNGKVVSVTITSGTTQVAQDGTFKIGNTAYKVYTTLGEKDKHTNILSDNNQVSFESFTAQSEKAQSTAKKSAWSKIFGGNRNKAQAAPTPTVGQVDAIRIGDEGIKDGVLFNTDEGQIFQDVSGTYYFKPTDKDWVTTPCTNCEAKKNKLITDTCKTDEDCKKRINDQVTYHQGFANFMKQQRKFTFQEGITMGSNLWSLGTKYKFWSEASNPMSQLNEFFTNSKTGLLISGNWEKSICWEETDFNNPNDGIAFVPGTENVGAWVAGEVITIKHPTLADPTVTTTDYIYRITSVVDPRGLTTNSGSSNCLDFIDFQYTIDGHAIDLDMDGRTSDDVVRILCDSSSYSLTGQNAIVRNSTKKYSTVCIQFQGGMLKSSFYNALDGGRLCAPIIKAGTETTTACSWCPGIFTDSLGATTGGSIGFGSPYSTSTGAAPTENRPGVSNPTSI